jgi:hypothetical protein
VRAPVLIECSNFKKKFFSFVFLFFLFFFVFDWWRGGSLLAASLHRGLLGAALDGRRILLLVLHTNAVAAVLRGSPALRLEVLLRLHREGEVLGAASTVDEHWRHALVGDGAVIAPLGLLPALLLEDTRLAVREEERVLTIRARQVGARGLRVLLGLATVRAARGLRVALLLEEELILAREGEGRTAVHTGKLLIGWKARTLLLGIVVVTTTRLLLLLSLALCLGLCLLPRKFLLELGDALVGAVEEILHPLRILPHRDTVKCVLTLGLGPQKLLTIDERHFVCFREILGKGAV